MQLSIKQTEAGLKKSFSITGCGMHYSARQPSLRPKGELALLSGEETLLSLKHRAASFLDAIPLGMSLGRTRRFARYDIFNAHGENQGMFEKVCYARIKERYDITTSAGTFVIYPLLKGNVESLLIFAADTQVGHIARETSTLDQRDVYRLYLLDVYGEYAALFAMFTVYYDLLAHGDQGVATKNYRRKSFGWSYGDANTLYDPEWLRTNFPDAPDEPVQMDEKCNKRLSVILTLGVALLDSVIAAAVIACAIWAPERLVAAVMIFLVLYLYTRLRYRW